MDSNGDSLILNIVQSTDSPIRAKKRKNVHKVKTKPQPTNDGNRDHKFGHKRPDDVRRGKPHVTRDARARSGNNRPQQRDKSFSFAKLNSRLFDAVSDEKPIINLTDTESRVEPVFSSHKYSELALHPYLVKCLSDRLSITETTAVQNLSIPVLLNGCDALIKSMTGSGKTLAFAVPIIQMLQSYEPQITRSDGIHAVVIVPTRELALQCYQCFEVLCQSFKRLVTGYLCGGEKKKSEKARIRKGLNVLVATPGRLIDHMYSTGKLYLSSVKWLVIDEADRLLEQGFEESVHKIVNHLSNVCQIRPQTVLLSATLTSGVERLAGMSLSDPKVIDISGDDSLNTVVLPANLSQNFIVCAPKLRLITLSALLVDKCSLSDSKALVFMPSQDVVDFHCVLFTNVLNRVLNESQQKTIDFYQLHGNMDQSKRRQVFNEFRDARNAVLFCTDVASRGLDLPKVDWIVQFSCAAKPEDFVHRVGRTARIGNSGNAVQFVLPTETKFLELLQKELKINFNEMQLKEAIKSLMLLDFKRKGIHTAEEYAQQLQTKYEDSLTADQDLMGLAKKAYLSYIRSYVAYPKNMTSWLPFRDLHLGHLVKSFALQESPKALGAFGFRLKQQSIDLQHKYEKYNRRIDGTNRRKAAEQLASDGQTNDESESDSESRPTAPKMAKHTLLPLEMRISEFGGPLITKPSHLGRKRNHKRR